MSEITRKKTTGEAGNGGEFGSRQRPEPDTQLSALPRVFTPIAADSDERLRIDPSAIEIVSGSPFTSGRGKRGRINVDGVPFDVVGKACGGACFCDAKLVAVPSEE